MEIPLIVDREGLHSMSDGMLRQLLKLCIPMRVHRPIDLESPANPIEKFLLALLFGRLSCVMDAGQPYALFHERIELLQMVFVASRVAAAAIAVDYDAI